MSQAAYQLLSQFINVLKLKRGSIKTIEVMDAEGYRYEVTIKPIYKHDAAPLKEKRFWL